VERLWRGYLHALQWVCAALLTWIVGVTLVNVTMRYLFSSPIVWADESARLSFVVFTFLAAGLAAAGGSHLAIDSLERFAEARSVPGGTRTLRWLRRVAGLCFGLLLIVGGWTAARNNMAQLSPALRFPMGWIYLALPAGGFLMILGQIGDARFPASRALARAEDDTTLDETGGL
jgi:TRAP-type transport system small permease protein